MSYLFQIIEAEAQPVLSVQTVTAVKDMPQVVGDIYGAIANYIVAKGGQLVGPAFIAYYNMDMENLQIEVGFPLLKEMEGEGNIVLRQIPAGKRAVGFHKGAYSDMTSIYEALTAFLMEKGHQPTGIAYEYYYNSPEEVPESELLTKVELLLDA